MMRLFLATLGVALGASNHAQQNNQGVAAIQKVIQMMGDMQAKAKKEKADEEVTFSKFSQWCKMQNAQLTKTIAKSAGEIESLGTSIDKLKDDAKTLGEEVGKLQSLVAEKEGDMKARKNTRAKEHEAYVAESTDYAESISAIERAVTVLSKENYDRDGGAAALLQVTQSTRMPEKAKDVIAAFLGYSEDSDDEDAAPEAHGYEFQSGSIVNMLKSLNDDFRTKKDTCDKEEANAKHAHDMVMMDLADIVSTSERDASEKSSTKSKHQQKASLNKKQKTGTEGVKLEDESTLKNVDTECAEKKQSFTDKQQLRTEEIEAIGAAIKIMSGSDVSSFIQSAAVAGGRMTPSSYAQLRSASSSQAAAQGRRHKVREFIARESNRLKSRTLSLLAETLEADPFAKVKGLIENMLTKLRKEANEDAEHEGFCDTEMGKSKNTRTHLAEEIDSLTASIDDSQAEILTLTDGNANLNQGISELTTALTEATAMRTAEKAKNKATVDDADLAVKAVDAATAILKDFYKKASQSMALVQGGQGMTAKRGITMGSDEWEALGSANAAADPKDKQTFGDAYKGNQDSANGVLAMIEVIRSDFANLAADTKNSETAAVEEFDSLKVETKKNVATKSKKVELNEADKVAAQAKLVSAQKDLKSNTEELAAAQRYSEKLEQQCVAKGSSYEDRTKARAAEIQSLKEALKMLD